jgi:hypothetical protein
VDAFNKQGTLTSELLNGIGDLKGAINKSWEDMKIPGIGPAKPIQIQTPNDVKIHIGKESDTELKDIIDPDLSAMGPQELNGDFNFNIAFTGPAGLFASLTPTMVTEVKNLIVTEWTRKQGGVPGGKDYIDNIQLKTTT